DGARLVTFAPLGGAYSAGWATKTRRPPRSTRRYAQGTRTRVTRVDVKRPPITARARGAWISLPSPTPTASGTSPRAVVSVVIAIGRSRRRPASTIASTTEHPRPRKVLA